jgi:hypothetical protein
MRKSLLTAMVIVALASGAAPGFAAANTQRQQQASATEQPHCTAVSAKDVALDKNKCG